MPKKKAVLKPLQLFIYQRVKTARSPSNSPGILSLGYRYYFCLILRWAENNSPEQASSLSFKVVVDEGLLYDLALRLTRTR